MYHFIIMLLIILSSIKWGSWTRWNEFLPTMYFFSFFNLFYQYISYTIKPVWELKHYLVSMFVTDTIYTMVAYPALIVLFLSHFPENNRVKVMYYLKYIVISTFIEWIAVKTHSIVYFDGWNLKWTILFYSIMYPMLQLHYRKPVLALCTSIIVVAFFLFSFSYRIT